MKKEWLIKTLVFGIILMCLNISTVLTIANQSFEKYSSMIYTLQDLHNIKKTESRGINVTLDGPRGENGWFVGTPIYIVITPDSGTQIEKIFYKIGSGPLKEIPWTGHPIPIFIIDDGGIPLYLIIYDTEGNVWDFFFEIKIDMTPPTLSLIYNVTGGNPITGWILTFIATATDAVSGMDRVEFYVGDVLQENITGPGPTYKWVLKFINIPHLTIKAVGYDIAGNNNFDEIQDPKPHSNEQTIPTKPTLRNFFLLRYFSYIILYQLTIYIIFKKK